MTRTDATSTGSGTSTGASPYSASASSFTCSANDFCYAFVGYQPCGTSSAPTYDSAFTSMSARGPNFVGATNCRTAGGAVKYNVNAADEYLIPGSSASRTAAFSLPYGTTIGTGTWGWAEVVGVFKPSTTLSVNAYTTNSAGTHQDTLVSSGTTGNINSVKSEVISAFSSSAGTVPTSGYIEVTVTASASVTIYWGSGQLTNFQTPKTYDYVLKVVNTAGDSWQISLIKAGSSSISRLTNLTIWFHDGSTSVQIVVTSGAFTQSSGAAYTLPASTTVYIALTATASSSGTSTVDILLKVKNPGSTAYSYEVIGLTVN